MHTLYSPLDDGETLYSADQIKPVYIKEEVAGVPYYIDHQLIHNLKAVGEGKCISLMLCSPAKKRRALHHDFGSGESWWRYGSKERTEESLKNTKSVDRNDVENLIQLLTECRII
ncbi:MAG: hypothetical protein ABW072_14895 [Sedimenticola sp.]